MERVYLDWAATAPYAASVANFDWPAAIPFANPSSQHAEGKAARQALESARERCAQALAVKPKQLYFTSGATEANQLILDSQLLKAQSAIALSRLEHPSLTAKADLLSQYGGLPSIWLKPEADGRLDPDRVVKMAVKNHQLGLVSCTLVNNETGVRQDLKAISHGLRANLKAPFLIHCDAVQAFAKQAVPVSELDIDSFSLSAHKLGGPKGLGLLYLRQPIESWNRGGGQETGIRSGTENVWAATCLAGLLESALEPSALEADLAAAEQRMADLISFLNSMSRCSLIPADRCPVDNRFSPFILQMALRDIPGEVLVRFLDDQGIAISTGSACSSKYRRRPVLEAMGVDDRTAFESVRISQGRTTTSQEIERLKQLLTLAVEKL